MEKKLKRICIVCLLAAVTLAMSVCAFAASVSIPAMAGDAGATYDIPVNIDDATGVAGYQFTVTYNASVLNCTEAPRGSLTAGFDTPSTTITSGKVITLSIEPNLTELGAGTGSLAFLKCTATGSPGAVTSLHFAPNPETLLSNSYGDLVPATYVDGSFKINGGQSVPHTVTPSIGQGAGHGTITPGSPQPVEHGTAMSFTVTPQAGYTVSVGGTCGGTLAGTTYTTHLVIADCTVVANFKSLQDSTFIVTPSLGEGAGHGTITPDRPQTAAHGAEISFTIAPQAGYSTSVEGTCGGTLEGTAYTTAPVTADCTVVANFKSLRDSTFSVTPLIGQGAGHGTITQGTPQAAAYGKMKLFTVKPDAGYWATVNGTCGGWLNGISYNTAPVREDCTVIAHFYAIEMISQVFPPYPPLATPVPSETLSHSFPIGIGPLASGGETLDFSVETGLFSSPVDIYMVLWASMCPDYLWFLNADGSVNAIDFEEAVQAFESQSLKPMIPNTLLAKTAPLTGILVRELPPGIYSVFLLATPPGSMGAFYLWQTDFAVGAL